MWRLLTLALLGVLAVPAFAATVDPGSSPRNVLKPTEAQVRAWAWSPDGREVAVGLGADPGKRHARHPWPHGIPRSFEMFSRAGDAAVRAVVVRVATGLRQGAGHARTMQRLRTG